jgi:rhodanese-related sulfurtransferase
LKTTLLEFVIIAILGSGIGLVANAVNADGLDIGHQYFKKFERTTTRTAPATNPGNDNPTTRTSTVPDTQDDRDPFIAYIEDVLGLQAVTHDKAVETYLSDAHLNGRYIFIDARNDEEYREGHIPGAYQLNHFFPDRHLPEVLQACAMADRIIVYCNGGECEDSEYTMKILLDEQVDYNRLFIYAHGFTAWKEADLPIETDERNSGMITGGDEAVSHE